MNNKTWLIGGGLLAGMLLSGARPALGAQEGKEFRTDINPALRYYQAFIVKAPLGSEDYDYLIGKEWRGRELDDRAQELVAGFDLPFRIYRRASHATVPCDWGFDVREGPEALLPYLSKGKQASQLARLRAMWHLQNKRPEDARDDLLAVDVLARNLSSDGTLISALVEIAMENIVTTEVAGDYYRFTPEIFNELVDGFDAGPKRGRIIDCMAVERGGMSGWFLARIKKIRDENRADPATAMRLAEKVLDHTQGGEDNDPTFVRTVSQAAGGTIDGVVKLLEDLNPFYDRLEKILVLPPAQFDTEMAALDADLAKTKNPLAGTFLASFRKCRVKEFANDIRLSMLHAAAAYRNGGETALRQVQDPCGNGPFQLERFVFEGQDRGFKLSSAYKGRGFEEVLIFVEKPGPAFFLDAGNAGKPVSAN